MLPDIMYVDNVGVVMYRRLGQWWKKEGQDWSVAFRPLGRPSERTYLTSNTDEFNQLVSDFESSESTSRYREEGHLLEIEKVIDNSLCKIVLEQCLPDEYSQMLGFTPGQIFVNIIGEDIDTCADIIDANVNLMPYLETERFRFNANEAILDCKYDR